jgi:hypothetical protein
MILPRQARDKHRENSKKEAVLSQAFDTDGDGSIGQSELGRVLSHFGYTLTDKTLGRVMDYFDDDHSRSLDFGKETHPFLRHFMVQMIILPRQARDKHRESTHKKSGGVSAGEFMQLWGYLSCLQRGVVLFDGDTDDDGGGGGGSGGGGGGGGRGGEAQDSSGPVSLARTESRGRAGALEAENARLKAATADLEEKLLSATKELMVREGEVPEPTTRNVNEMITAIHKEVEKLFDQPAKVRKRSL